MKPPTIVNIHKVKGVRPAFDLYIGRATNRTEFTTSSKWSNPFTKWSYGERAIPMYEFYIRCCISGIRPMNDNVLRKVLGISYKEEGSCDGAWAWMHCSNQGITWDIDELTSKKLGCWCKPAACHGDVLIKLWKEKHHDE